MQAVLDASSSATAAHQVVLRERVELWPDVQRLVDCALIADGRDGVPRNVLLSVDHNCASGCSKTSDLLRKRVQQNIRSASYAPERPAQYAADYIIHEHYGAETEHICAHLRLQLCHSYDNPLP